MKKTITTLVFLLLVVVAAVAAPTYSRDMYEKAILGDAEAMYQLSVCYMNGTGVAADYDRSDYWLERAAQEGQPNAMAALRAMLGKTGLSDAKRRELAAEEMRERERLEANRCGNGNDGGGSKGQGNQTFTVGGVSFTMVYVEGGTFTMGATSEQGSDAWSDKSEKPAHNVTLSSYHIGETEVTQELWQAVMGENPSNFKGNKYPVEQVSWKDCEEFIKRLNKITGKHFRLPTEAEWEFAARGGNLSKGYQYSGSDNLDDVAWFHENSSDKGSSSPDYGTHPVASKQPNELGLYDMSGNVSEWCSDWFEFYSSIAQTNPTGPSSGSSHVHRGGSCCGVARYCRVSYRFGGSLTIRLDFLGLRLAL